MFEFYKETIGLMNKGEIDQVSQRIEKVLLSNEEVFWKAAFVSLYLDIAEVIMKDVNKLQEANLLATKVLQIFSKYRKKNSPNPALELNRARAFGLKYDISYLTNRKVNKSNWRIDYSSINSIYNVEKYLIDSIILYRNSLLLFEKLETEESKNEIYNIRNNLGQHLSRTGRYVEALQLFETNIKHLKDRWQSYVCYGDILHTFTESSLIEPTLSLFINISEAYLESLGKKPHRNAKIEVESKLKIYDFVLKDNGLELGEKLINKNRAEERKEYGSFDDQRKFVLDNNLALNEHSIYCKCKSSEKDDLKIGKRGGSKHAFEFKRFEKIDGIVNRIVSEFCYSRLLYYNHISNKSIPIKDVEFSTLSSSNDLVGYEIEQLRNSYRSIYSVLDKIMNGVLILYNLKRKSNDYFESFFSTRKDDFLEKNNIHLAALLSISKELDHGKGSFQLFKKVRNKMEHSYLPINDFYSDEDSISLTELENLTLNLLHLTRSAIFSFVFLLRTETILTPE